jgi:lipopolysaccharide biosynthesis glycosyltransferase
MKTVFFTFISDDYYQPVGTPMLINSFKKFHPDIPLVVFRQDVVDKIIDPQKKFMGGAVNWLNAKPMFAKLLTDKYDLVVNIDADSVVLGRLDELLEGDYHVGSVLNVNDFENRHIGSVTDEMYLQAGLIASTRPEFWDIWMAESLKNNWQYKCAENDSMNIVIYEQLKDWKLKIFDEKGYWGCKLLDREKECVIERGKVMCRGEEVKIYHAAKGPMNLPKLTTEKLQKYGFNQEVINHINNLGHYGTSVIYHEI